MAEVKAPNVLEKPGDYTLKEIVLVNSIGEKFDIKPFVLELNIYEGIHMHTMVGNLVMTDIGNLVNLVPLQGNERLYFKVQTPGATGQSEMIDMSDESGHAFIVTRLSDRKEISDRAHSYILHFGTKEHIRNLRTRVSQAYDGPLEHGVLSMIHDEAYLNSQKQVFFEPTRNKDKIVIGNKRPFAAIDMICHKALSQNGKGAGYFFYETTKGFHFRSWESMVAYQANVDPKDQNAELLELTTKTQLTPNKQGRLPENQLAIDSYSFPINFDTEYMQGSGAYSQKVIMYNVYNKSFTTTEWKYHNYFDDFMHTDKNPVISSDPVDLDPKEPIDGPGDKGVSNYPGSYTSLIPTTRYAHNDNTGLFGDDPGSEGLTEAIRHSSNQIVMRGSKVMITMKGNARLQAGQLVKLNILPIDKDKSKRKVTKGIEYPFDDHFSGRFVISAIHHRMMKEGYQMICECVKDGVHTPYEEGDIYYTGTKEKTKGFRSIYELDSSEYFS